MNDTSTLTILSDLISTVETQVERFPLGSAQHTLQANRLRALTVALAICHHEVVTEDDLRRAQAPLASLISKSEKAMTKLNPKTWSAQRLRQQVEALNPVLREIRDRLASMSR